MDYKLTPQLAAFVKETTGKTPEQISELSPEEIRSLLEAKNGSLPSWSTKPKGYFRGRGNINIAGRRLKTLDSVDKYLDAMVSRGARQYS